MHLHPNIFFSEGSADMNGMWNGIVEPNFISSPEQSGVATWIGDHQGRFCKEREWQPPPSTESLALKTL